MKSVNELLNKERQAKEAIVEAQNVLANIGQEKVDLGLQILAEAKEKLDVLEVGYLLNTNIAERVMAPVRITRLDGRVLKLRARKQDAEKIAELEKQLKETQDELDAAQKKEQEYADVIKDYDTKEKELEKKISELESSNNSDILKQAIVSKDKYIAELQSKLSDKAYQAANDGYVVDGVEISLAVVNELNNEIEKLREEMAEKEHLIAELNKKVKALELTDNASEEFNNFNDPGYQEILMQQAEQYMNNDIDECLFVADDMELENNANQVDGDKDKQISDIVKNVLDNRKGNGERVGSPKERLINEFNNISDEDIEESIVEIKTEETVEEETVEVVAPEFAKVVKTKVNFKGGNAKLFKTDNCYLIASPSAREITWLSKEELTDEYKQSVVNTLVRDYKFHEHRTELSPIIIDDEKIYMARTYAKAGVGTFCNDDIIAGHVKIGGSKDFILYTYFPNTDKAIIESLEKKLLMAEGKLKAGNTMPDNKALLAKVNAAIRGTYKKYKAQTDVVLKQQQADAKKADETFNASQDELDKILAAQNAIIAAAAKNDPSLAAAYNQNNNINNGGDNKGDSNAEKVVVEPIFRLSASLSATAEEYDI